MVNINFEVSVMQDTRIRIIRNLVLIPNALVFPICKYVL